MSNVAQNSGTLYCFLALTEFSTATSNFPSQEQSCNLTIISVVTTTADTILHQDVELASRRKVKYCEVLMKSSDLKRLKSHSQQNAEAQISSKNSIS